MARSERFLCEVKIDRRNWEKRIIHFVCEVLSRVLTISDEIARRFGVETDIYQMGCLLLWQGLVVLGRTVMDWSRAKFGVTSG